MITKVTTTQISNQVIATLIQYDIDYPWHLYIASSEDQFEEILPALIAQRNKVINIILNTDDCLLEFNTDIPDEDLEPDTEFLIKDLLFRAYFD